MRRGGAVHAVLDFWLLFDQEKKKEQPLAVSKHTYSNKIYTTFKTTYTILHVFT
jgi:hypothetical protein